MEEEPLFKALLDKHCLSVLSAFIRDFGLYWHQLSSFNDLFEQHLENLEDVYIDPVVLKAHGNNKVIHFRFGQVRYSRPDLVDDDNRVTRMFPKLARMRGETYGAGLHVDIHVFVTNNEDVELTYDTVQAGFNRRRRKPQIIEDFEGIDDDGLEEAELEYGITHRVQPQVFLTLFPIMVGSRLCRLYGLPDERLIELGEPIYEPKGYFILRGKERVIISQKNLGKNTLFISRESEDQVLGTLHASVECPDTPRVVNKIDLNYDKEVHDTLIRVHINQVYIPKGVPIGIIFTMCGISNWTEVINLVSGFARVDTSAISKILRASENDFHAILAKYENQTKFEAAWNWFSDHVSSKQRIKMQDKLPQHLEVKRLAAQEVIHTYLFPHVQDGIPKIQSPEDYWSVCRVKGLTLAHLASQVIRVHLGFDKPTDRDHMEHRRYDSPGSLLLKLFRSLLRPQLSDFRTQIGNMDKNNKPIDIASAMCSERLQKGLIGALQSGKFQLTRRTGRQSAATATAGVSQAFSRINPSTGISLLRKTASQGTRKIPAGARLLHPTQWGFQCVAETPEGQPCGIVNHLTLLSYCSEEYPSKIVFDWILKMIPEACPVYSLEFNPNDWRMVINGRIAFSLNAKDDSDPVKWVKAFKQSRYLSEIPRDISISFNPISGIKEIRIYCDGGRLVRPLCVVENKKLQLTSADIHALDNKGMGIQNTNLEELFRQGKFEYVDGAETEDTYVATFFSEVSGQEDYTHCEPCPLSILGVAAALSPYSDANQSPRNVYSAGMTKQAMGTPSFPIHGNLRTTDHMLETSERPLVSTLLHRIDELPIKWLPTGKNCIVCVKADAHNVEDSIIMNETFIQNGGLSSFTDRTYTQTAQKNHHHSNMDAETFERPDEDKTAQYKSEARYDKIHDDGLPVPNELVTSETVIIGKTGPLPTPPADPTARNRSVDRSHINADPNHTRRDLSTMPRKNGGGVIQSVILSHTRDTKRVAVTLRTYRKPQIGDKFASR